jgi:AcrR family transcriptional regulator
MDQSDSKTRRRILRAALKLFATGGYAATSVQQIVDAARVTKPVLYYHCGNKAGLYQALVDYAHDERYRLMRAAAEKGGTLREKLVEVLSAHFEFLQQNREVMRIAFATYFAAPGELPEGLNYMEQGRRNFEFVHQLIHQAQIHGEISDKFTSVELAMSSYGLMNIYVMSHLVNPQSPLTRQTAERVVDLLFTGVRPG